MTQRHEAASDDEVRGIEPPLAAANAVGGRVPDPASGVPSEKGRVLLLDNDPAFREGIRDFLAANGYTVVAIQNGAEGIREVVDGDFVLVLCDFIMPGLSGDTFYRAVERIRPALCQRFVFMSGHQNDAAMIEFITKRDAVVLQKPFPLTKLLSSIAVAEARTTFQSVCDHSVTSPDFSHAFEPVNCFRAVAPPLPSSAILRILARIRTDRPAAGPSEALSDSEPRLRAGGISRAYALAALVLFFGLMAGLWIRYGAARGRVDGASAERLALNAEWIAISANLQKAVSKQSETENLRKQLAGISADRAKPRWMPALRSVVACAGQEIQLREVRATEKSGDEKTWDLLIGGVAIGANPRGVSDRFRAALQGELEQIFQAGVRIRFDRFEEGSALPNHRRGAFTMTATIRFGEEATVESKEGA